MSHMHDNNDYYSVGGTVGMVSNIISFGYFCIGMIDGSTIMSILGGLAVSTALVNNILSIYHKIKNKKDTKINNP